MRVVVFALAAVGVLSGISAYADQMAVPSATISGVAASSSAASEEMQQIGSVPAVQLLDVQTTSAPTKPTAVTAEPSSMVLMATGCLGVGGLMWRRRSLTRA